MLTIDRIGGRRLLTTLCAGVAALSLAACSSTSGGRPSVASVSPAQALAEHDASLGEEVSSSVYASPEQIDVARQRSADILGPKATAEFRMFIYINKQASGPMAQQAYLFTKDDAGQLQHLDTWLVTTAREQHEVSPKGEKKFTTTPVGVYQFDPNLFVRIHKSNAWESDMPWAMFLKSRSGGPTQGYALHAALDKYVHNLGQRASAGCIRLMPANAEKLYKLLQREYAGQVPKTSSNGSLDLTVSSSRIRGIQALVIVDDEPGNQLIARYGNSMQQQAGLN